MKGPIRPTNKRRMKGRPPYVVSALRRKYAELLGADDPQAPIIGAALLIFNPGEDLYSVRPVRPYKAERERWMQTALNVMHHEKRPMTSRELALKVMEACGVPADDYRRFKSIECGLHIVLGRLEGDGVTRPPGSPKRWVLTPYA